LRSQIVLGKIFGIRVGLHFSWFLIALLIVSSLFAELRSAHADWNPGIILVLAALTALAFFVSLLLHELSHSLVAVRYGLPVREITLFALGGVSQIEGEAPNAKAEFRIAAVGPATSVLLGIACSALSRVSGNPDTNVVAALLIWLGYINLGLAIFNLIPGYPLDGGRVLRAIIWWKTGNMNRATRSAARIGQAIAVAFIVLGLLRFMSGAGIAGLWIAFVGWFLLQAARESYSQIDLRRTLDTVHVTDVMTRDCTMVDGQVSVQDFVDHELLRTGRRCFVVEQQGRPAGLITLHQIKQLDRSRWPLTTLEEIMIPLAEVHSVAPSTTLGHALELMSHNDLNQLAVISDGHLDGMLSRRDLLGYFQTRAEIQT
jgi:Zn-dependent protease/predicted transcriptional regulator